MRLHRDRDTTQKSAGFLAHRLRGALAVDAPAFAGPVEVDVTGTNSPKWIFELGR